MSEYVITPPATPSLAVEGQSARFPLRRVFCVGRNYADHAREMGHDPDREPPFFFGKPADAVIPASGVVPYPSLTQDLNYEVELVVAIGKGGKNISQETALEHVWGYTVGVDLTLRDLQTVAKKQGRPWDLSKGFDASAPTNPLILNYEVELVVAIGKGGKNISQETALEHVWGYTVGVDLTLRDLQTVAKKQGRPWDLSKGFDASAPTNPLIPVSQSGHMVKGLIWLSVNGEKRQDGHLSHQIWPVADVISYLSQAVELQPGDLIYTGTPAGVGTIKPGDVVTGGIKGLGTFSFTVGTAE